MPSAITTDNNSLNHLLQPLIWLSPLICVFIANLQNYHLELHNVTHMKVVATAFMHVA
jgi:hypothetical protein